MWDWNTAYKTDTWSIGWELQVQYLFSEEEQKKIPTGIVLSLHLFTRLVEIAFWWGAH